MTDVIAPEILEILDEILTHMYQSVIFDVSRYGLVVVAVFMMGIASSRLIGRRRIQARKISSSDIVRELVSSLRTIAIFAATMSILIIAGHFDLVEITNSYSSKLIVVAQSLILILFHDTYFYWAHRLLHTKRFFRIVHYHHHKSISPTPLSSYSFSSIEAFVEIIFAPIFLIIMSILNFDYSIHALLIFLWFMLLRNVTGHAGYEIHPSWWVDNAITDLMTTTTHHNLHHSHPNCNLGLYFTWWDRWMGTEYKDYKGMFRRNAHQVLPEEKGDSSSATN